MKKSIALLLSIAMLAGCSSGSGTAATATSAATGGTTTTVYENDYTYSYTADMTTFDYLFNNKSTNGDKLVNCVEGLLTQDPNGTLVGGMAETWEANDDATVWTFHIRKDAKWVTNNQEEYAAVTANDFVAGLQHAADFQSETLWLVSGLITGLQDYVDGAATWDEVGIKATDDYTLEYTLTGSAPYFDSITTYSILYPVNQEFLESQGEGCKLGAGLDETCDFGSLDPTTILYNSAYVMSSYTSKSSVEFTRNETYWDVKNVHIPNAKLVYNDGSDPDYLYKAFKNGELSAATIVQTNPDTVADAEATYGENIYTSDTTSSSFWATFNYNRSAYSVVTDPSKGVSTKTDAQKADTKTAILNKNFRLGVFAAFSDEAYGKQSRGDELALTNARNTLTAYNFVKTSEGTTYGDMLTEKLQAYDATNFGDVNLADGQDAYYNPDKAKAYLEAASTELADGITSWPVYLDVPVNETNDINTRRAQAIKQSIEDAIGDYVKINLVMMDEDSYYNSWYYINSGADANFDFVFAGGWGPDYADPRTYLNIFLPDTGDMLNMSGLSIASLNVEGEAEVKDAIGLTKFGEVCAEADAITNDNDARYEKYAEAEAILLGEGIIRPFSTNGGNYAVSKVVPYSGAYGLYGAASTNETPMFKYMQVADEPITKEEHDAAKAAWESNM